ncbi:MAG: glycosyltransferase family 9 protein [Actinomycetota bacterium]|nr:glycosyltransferase family 9 protein [Actinomycetota bacterium]
MSTRMLCVRLDSAGDVLLTGPAIRAVAAQAEVVLLAGPEGEAAAQLLPGPSEVMTWRCPWIVREPGPTTAEDVDLLIKRLSGRAFDGALIFTSFHQSPLPTALVLRMAGIPRIGAISTDYPGSLLDLRHRVAEDIPEPERAGSLAAAAGYTTPPDDDGKLHVRAPLPDTTSLVGDAPYVVLHPGTSVPARAWPREHFRQAARLLAEAGWHVVVTGSPGEAALTRAVAVMGDPWPGWVTDLGGRTDLATLAAVLKDAAAVVVGNTGPAHLAAAVQTPVVSLFAPTVPAVRWRPYGVPHVLLGDQQAECRNTRVTRCPYPGHPCLSSVLPSQVVEAVHHLVGAPMDQPIHFESPTEVKAS